MGENWITHTTYIHRLSFDDLALISLERVLSESQIIIIYLATLEYNKYAVYTSEMSAPKRILSKDNF